MRLRRSVCFVTDADASVDEAGSGPRPAQRSIRIAVAEDNFLVREGLRHLIELSERFTIVAVCDDLESVLSAVEAKAPDVVVTDIRMPPDYSDEGIRLANFLRETRPSIGVVVVSGYADPSYAVALLDHGSERRAYLLKDRIHEFEHLESAIDAVAGGGSMVDPKIVEALVLRNDNRAGELGRLTPRETDILELMAQGKNNAGIARALSLTEHSVEKYVSAVLGKLDLGDLTDVHKRVKAVLVYLSVP
jgi:DNA-binding NarL/FixJ family response regulator